MTEPTPSPSQEGSKTAVGAPSEFPSSEGTGNSSAKSGKKWLLVVLMGLVVIAALATWKFVGTQQTKQPTTQPSQGGTHTPALPKVELTESQSKSTLQFLAAAAAVSESLAADNLAGFNRAAGQVGPALDALFNIVPGDHPWRPLLQKIADTGKLVPAGDLAEARKEFIPFSTAVTDFVRPARHQADALRSLKLYRCPMAPQPGFWLQLDGPLRNPYFGSEMLDCGNEIQP